ncbi:MAG: hypothetical protein EP318_14625, partial [Rhodobacteraceae bacterium]
MAYEMPLGGGIHRISSDLPWLDGCSGANAQRHAPARRARRRKLIRLPGLREAGIDCLKEGWSDEQIEPPRVYRRVKLSKDEPYGSEEAYPEVYIRVP